MRIAYITDQLLPQNATDTSQLMNMTSAFGAAGADITIVTPHRVGRKDATVEELCRYYEVEPTFRLRFVRSLYPSQRGVEKVAHAAAALVDDAWKSADVIYSRNIPVVTAALLRRRPQVVYETYRPWPAQQPLLGPLFRLAGNDKRFAGAVLHSQLAARSYKAVGVPGDKLLVAHNGYDPRKFEPALSKSEARRRVGLPQDARIVGYAGRISPQKGIGMLLDLAAAIPQMHLVLVGSEGNGPIERRAALMSNVTVVPWQSLSGIVPFLYACDVVAIPPTRGPLEVVGNTVLPIKTFQYLATARPIFGPASPDLEEVVADGHGACLVKPDDLPLAISRMRELLADEERLQRLGTQAKEIVSELTWANRAKKVLSFMEDRLR